MTSAWRSGAALLALALLAFTLSASGGVVHAQAAAAAPPAQTFHPPPALGRAPRPSSAPASLSSSHAPLFDEQLGITYQSVLPSISYNVTAVAQTDKSTGYGPAYLVNGLTTAGYWYQIGLSYDWPYIGTGYYPGFGANFEVFNASGSSVFPSMGGGLLNFSGQVNPGDLVTLSLFFANGNITMQAADISTGAKASISYGAQGADSFIGISNGPANPDGFFTGLMTEWYHSSVYKSNPMEVIYSTPNPERSGLMWMDEFNVNASKLVFEVIQQGPVTYTDPTRLVSLSADGALLYSDAYEFITGGLLGVQTPIILQPGPGTPSLSPANGFRVTYSVNGTTDSSYDTGNLTVTSDADSTITVAGVSAGSNSTVRWTLDAQGGSILIEAGTPTTRTYHLQFLLTTEGTSMGDSWWDSGVQANVSVPGVFGRVNGTGYRVASYTVDGGPPVKIAPTTGPVNVTVLMSSPRTLDFNTVAQYEVALGNVPAAALASASPPTIPGDGRWYDSGTAVTVALDGVWQRSGGSGERLTSFSVNGAPPTAADTAGTVDALDGPITGPVSLNVTATEQYQLSTSGSLSSVTPTPIAGDAGWYDAGTQVQATFEYSWNVVANQSRLNAIGYAVDGGETLALSRDAGGTFTVSVTMTSAQTISVESVTQFYLSVTTPVSVSISPASPTADSFYDQGMEVSLSAPFTVAGGTSARLVLSGFALDGQAVAFVWRPSGDLEPARLSMNGPHSVDLSYARQYLVSFQTVDASGVGLSPSAIEIAVDGGQPTLVNGSQAWLGAGSSFQLSSVDWEGENVAPAGQSPYPVSSPLNITVHARAYEATVHVVDYLGLPVSGASVAATLANGTVVRSTTGGGGDAVLGVIPLGTFTAEISSPLGTTTTSGDASGGTVTVRVFGSYPTLLLLAALVIAVVVSVAILARRRAASRAAPASPAR